MRSPDFWSRRDPMSRLLGTLLTPLSWLYGASIAWRAAHAHPYRSRLNVVCVGNLTAGGTGKTPIAIELGRMLIARGARPVFLSRGHSGNTRGPLFVADDDLATKVGDEPLLLSSVASTIVSRDRAAGARLAETRDFDTIIMDDGHQNFSLTKDVSLIVVDAEAGFGNNRILPAGPLREPVNQGLRRADMVILNGEQGFSAHFQTVLPTLRARQVSDTRENWTGKRVVAFCGIGRPQKFISTLSNLGAQVIEACAFADHHFYTDSEMATLRAKARAADATLVTTQKDFVRLPPSERQGIQFLPIRIAFDDPEQLERLLDRLVSRELPPKAR